MPINLLHFTRRNDKSRSWSAYTKHIKCKYTITCLNRSQGPFLLARIAKNQTETNERIINYNVHIYEYVGVMTHSSSFFKDGFIYICVIYFCHVYLPPPLDDFNFKSQKYKITKNKGRLSHKYLCEHPGPMPQIPGAPFTNGLRLGHD